MKNGDRHSSHRFCGIDLAIFGVLLAAPSLLMIGPLVRGAIPWFMDTVMYFFPLRVHAARLLGGGELPLWNRCPLPSTSLTTRLHSTRSR